MYKFIGYNQNIKLNFDQYSNNDDFENVKDAYCTIFSVVTNTIQEKDKFWASNLCKEDVGAVLRLQGHGLHWGPHGLQLFSLPCFPFLMYSQ